VSGTTELGSLTATVVAVSERLERCGIAHMLSGSFALTLYAEPRMTRDVDVVVDLGSFQVPKLVAALEPDFYVDAVVVREAVRARDMFNVVHEATGWKVDFIVAKEDPYRQLELSRRVVITLGGAQVPVVSREDLILSKLWWRKDSRSEQQLRDVRSLVTSSPSLDWTYLQRWAEHLGVKADLQELRSA